MDAPGGAGKVPIMPQYLISMSDKTAVVRNYAGAISAYPLPQGYTGECPPSCQHHAHEHDRGVAGMLDGQCVIIQPETTPSRGAEQSLLAIPMVVTESVCAHSV